MCARCCSKPITKIILIEGIEVGILGLDEIFRDVYFSNLTNEEKIKDLLLQKVRDYGNYVSQNRESAYKDALFSEYQKFSQEIEVIKKAREANAISSKKSIWKFLKKDKK